MAFHIRDAEADKLIRDLALLEGVTLTEAVIRSARDRLDKRKRELALQQRQRPLVESIRDLQEQVASRPKTGLKADKAFHDWLSGDE